MDFLTWFKHSQQTLYSLQTEYVCKSGAVNDLYDASYLFGSFRISTEQLLKRIHHKRILSCFLLVSISVMLQMIMLEILTPLSTRQCLQTAMSIVMDHSIDHFVPSTVVVDWETVAFPNQEIIWVVPAQVLHTWLAISENWANQLMFPSIETKQWNGFVYQLNPFTYLKQFWVEEWFLLLSETIPINMRMSNQCICSSKIILMCISFLKKIFFNMNQPCT